VESFIRTATDMKSLNEFQLIERVGEISRVLRHVQPLTADQVAEKVLRLHRKHADEVTSVIDYATSTHASAIREGRLPATCAIMLAVTEGYRKSGGHQISPVAPVPPIANEAEPAQPRDSAPRFTEEQYSGVPGTLSESALPADLLTAEERSWIEKEQEKNDDLRLELARVIAESGRTRNVLSQRDLLQLRKELECQIEKSIERIKVKTEETRERLRAAQCGQNLSESAFRSPAAPVPPVGTPNPREAKKEIPD
jgi:hypothetical protein